MTTIDTAKSLVKLVESETERVKAYINSLSPEALEAPSPCEMWNVGEVIAHLVWFAETYGGMMERGIRGDLSPSEGFPAVPGTINGPALDDLYAKGAIEVWQRVGRDPHKAFNDTYEWLNDFLKGIGPDDWDKPCYHTLMIRPVHSFMPTMIAELAVHEWDIRSPFEPLCPLSADAVPVLMDKIPGNRRPWSIPFETAGSLSGPI